MGNFKFWAFGFVYPTMPSLPKNIYDFAYREVSSFMLRALVKDCDP